MPKRSKPDAAERIAQSIYPEGTIDHAVLRMRLAARIRRYGAQRARGTRDLCALIAMSVKAKCTEEMDRNGRMACDEIIERIAPSKAKADRKGRGKR